MKIPYIVDIKDNSLDDGIGIRSVVFFKGCPLSCVWCQNPEAQNPGQELVFNRENCIHCKPYCFVNCPNDAFSYSDLQLERKKCKLSWECVMACPANVFSIAGRKYEIPDLIDRFWANEVFYSNSNGGVTLSGGEPMLYPDYVLELVLKLRQKHISIAIETCGHFRLNETVKHVIQHVQYLYYDLKFIDSKKHQQFCGVENTLILNNFRELIKNELVILPTDKSQLINPTSKPYLVPRVPLIPDLVTDSQNLKKIAQFLREYKFRVMDILPYNPLWIKKSHAIGRKLDYKRDTWMNPEEKSIATSFFQDFEFDTFTI